MPNFRNLALELVSSFFQQSRKYSNGFVDPGGGGGQPGSPSSHQQRKKSKSDRAERDQNTYRSSNLNSPKKWVRLRKSSFFILFVALVAKCGNFVIFLPLGFYVKTILMNSEIQKVPFLTVSKVLNFDF